MVQDRTYIAIDLKSFYASVECVELGLDPLSTNLVVADESRTSKTICLAVSPSMKEYGIASRARLFEVIERVRQVNEERKKKAPGHIFRTSSVYAEEVKNDPSVALDYIVAVPRMAFYIDYSAKIYETYLKYIAAEDIHVYSIDEVFIDATAYLKTYGLSAHDLAMKLIREVLYKTGVTATAGIGPNLYLAKIAMDIVAKKKKADKDGVRIAEIDERSYRELLWDHEPLTDFWRVGRGIAARLEKYGLHTMGDIARFSLTNDGALYDEFGINEELLIDHAWGKEPCTMKDIKTYKPSHNSLSSGQVLHEPYTAEKARIIVREMAYALSLDMTEKGLVTDHVSLYIGYDISSKTKGELVKDFYGRKAPKPAHSSMALSRYTSSNRLIEKALTEIYDRIVDKDLLIRRINIGADTVLSREEAVKIPVAEQTGLFDDPEEKKEEREKEERNLRREEKAQEAILVLKRRFGSDAVIKGINLEEGATGLERSKQIGGHRK